MRAAISTSWKQGDLCMRESKSMTGIYNSPIATPPFLSTRTSVIVVIVCGVSCFITTGQFTES